MKQYNVKQRKGIWSRTQNVLLELFFDDEELSNKDAEEKHSLRLEKYLTATLVVVAIVLLHLCLPVEVSIM